MVPSRPTASITQYRSQQSRNLGNPYKMAAKLCQFRSLIAGSGTQPVTGHDELDVRATAADPATCDDLDCAT